MKFIEDMKTVSDQLNDVLEKHLSLTDRYMEMASDKLSRSKESADLQYLSEQSSEDAGDTLAFLYTEAEEGFKASVKKSVDKLGEIFNDFKTGVDDNVKKLTYNDGVIGKKLDKLTKKVALNPFLKNIVVKFEVRDASKLYNSVYKKSVQAINIVLKSGNPEDVSKIAEEVAAEIAAYKKEDKKIQASYKVSDLTKFFDATRGSINKRGKQVADMSKTILKTCKKLAETSKNPAMGTALYSIGKNVVVAANLAINSQINACLDGVNAFEHALQIKKMEDKKNPKKENSEEKKPIEDKKEEKPVKESVMMGSDPMFEQMFDEFVTGGITKEMSQLVQESCDENDRQYEKFGIDELFNEMFEDDGFEKKEDIQISLDSLMKDFGV